MYNTYYFQAVDGSGSVDLYVEAPYFDSAYDAAQQCLEIGFVQAIQLIAEGEK